MRRRGRLEADRPPTKGDLRHDHGKRRLHAFGRQVKKTPARLRRAEIDASPRDRRERGGPACLPFRERARRPIPAAARPSRDSREGSAAPAEYAARARPMHAVTTPSPTAAPQGRPTQSSTRCERRGGTASSEKRLSAAASSPRHRTALRSCRRAPRVMRPVSSDTITATASFSSVSPIAARCRVPRFRASCGLTVSGRKQAAAATRSFCTITAPSCSGDFG